LHNLPKLFALNSLHDFCYTFTVFVARLNPPSTIDATLSQGVRIQWAAYPAHGEEFCMNKEIQRNEGLVRLIEKGKEAFHISENTDFYSKKDYRVAEKKYIKLCIIGREC
jgi:hypothetical protein